MVQFYKTDIEEQESIIRIDYYEKRVTVYTCRTSVYKRLIRKLGEPTQIYYTKGQISGAEWKIDFQDKRIKSAFSKPLFIGTMK